jgi:ribose transport system permease protein
LALGTLAVLAVRTPAVLSWTNLQAALSQAAPIGLVAAGLAVVVIAGGDDIIAGGIDLSLPAVATLSTAMLSMRLAGGETSFAVALAWSVLAAGAFGVLNAALVVGTSMTPILATLATSVLVSGVIRVVTTNRRITVADPVVAAIRDRMVLGVPLAALLALAAVAVLASVVGRTSFGVRLRAVGGNREAAVTAGLRPAGYLVAAFVIAALVAGLDGALLAARGTGFSPGMEERLLVDMVLAGYLSPVFSRRGVVSVGGALASALLVALLSNALILSRVDNSWVYGFKGALILTVVAFAALRSRSVVVQPLRKSARRER